MSDRDELEAQAAELGSELSLLRELLEHPAWARIATIIDGQVNERTRLVMNTQLQSLEQALGQEFMKGEVSGIKLIKSLPELEIERLQLEIDALNKQVQGDDNGGSTSNTDDRSTGGPGFGRPREPIDSGNDAFGNG